MGASAGAGAGALTQALAWRGAAHARKPRAIVLQRHETGRWLSAADGRRREDLGLGPGVVDGGERNKAMFAAWLRGAPPRGRTVKADCKNAPSSTFYGVMWDKIKGASWALLQALHSSAYIECHPCLCRGILN